MRALSPNETRTKYGSLIFSAPMMRAWREGRKTMTRRIVRPQPGDRPSDEGYGVAHRCPHPVGSVLWLRETCILWTYEDGGHGGLKPVVYADDPNWKGIKADITTMKRYGFPRDGIGAWKMRPSIHMPRWAAREWARVEAVRIERVQEITLPDVAAEGVAANNEQGWDTKEGFERLWESIHGVGSWEKNPWVWVYTLARIPKPEDA